MDTAEQIERINSLVFDLLDTASKEELPLALVLGTIEYHKILLIAEVRIPGKEGL